jgi:hypothetical protein
MWKIIGLYYCLKMKQNPAFDTPQILVSDFCVEKSSPAHPIFLQQDGRHRFLICIVATMVQQ